MKLYYYCIYVFINENLLFSLYYTLFLTCEYYDTRIQINIILHEYVKFI